MKMGKGSASKRALMTSGWAQAMERYMFKEDDIVMFIFQYSDVGGMVLLLTKIDA
jgi:hypothetical protein